MTPTYQTFNVVYEHKTTFSDTGRVNRATVTIYGMSELQIRAEIERMRPGHRDIVILEVAPIQHDR